MNVELLLQIKEAILKEPKKFDIRAVVGVQTPTGIIDCRVCNTKKNYLAVATCETPACIAGWTLILTNTKVSGQTNYLERARRLLGLTHEQARVLFFPFKWWASTTGRKYDEAKTLKGKARAAARYIDYFIKTDGKMS